MKWSQNTRRLLLLGFGGLLALMAFAGFDAIRILNTIQGRNDAIRSEFLDRNKLLNQIRSDLYLSGTYVRDYLLEPQPLKAELHRDSLKNARRDMEAALARYTTLIKPAEQKPFATLKDELVKYWRVLDPVVHWGPNERKMHGYPFLRDEVYPRRTAMLVLADEIGAVNERQLNTGEVQVGELFSGFRIRLGATLAATLGLGALLAGFSMVRILHLERESSARLADTAQARIELKELSARLVEAQETERKAISRELHDEVGQSLSALVVGLSNLSAVAATSEKSVLGVQISDLRKLAESSVGVVRNMTLLLRPSMLDDLGLVPALQWQAREVSKRSGMDVQTVADGVDDELPDDAKTAIYRVVQEALHNCEKHAKAKSVRVTVRQQKDELLLSVQDDGCGLSAKPGIGLGLRGMEERITNLGGIFNVESEIEGGTLIMVRLPVKRGRASRGA